MMSKIAHKGDINEVSSTFKKYAKHSFQKFLGPLARAQWPQRLNGTVQDTDIFEALSKFIFNYMW